MLKLSVNDVNYHKFSHGAASYTPNGKNVNVIELTLVSASVIIVVTTC